MDVAIGCGHDNTRTLAVRSAVFCIDIRLQQGYSLFHDLGRFNDLRQEHFSFAKELTDMFHSLHERLFDDINGASVFLQGFRDVLGQMVADALA